MVRKQAKGTGKRVRPRSGSGDSGDWDDGSSESTAHLSERSASYSLVLTLLEHAAASPALAAAIATADGGEGAGTGGGGRRSARRHDGGGDASDSVASTYPNGSAAANVFALLETLVTTSARLGAAAAAKAARNPRAFWRRAEPSAADVSEAGVEFDPAVPAPGLDGPRAVDVALAGCRLSEPELERVYRLVFYPEAGKPPKEVTAAERASGRGRRERLAEEASHQQAVRMGTWVETHTRARMAQLRAAEALLTHYVSQETGAGNGAAKQPFPTPSETSKKIKREFADLVRRRFRDADVDVRMAAAGAAAVLLLSTDSVNHPKMIAWLLGEKDRPEKPGLPPVNAADDDRTANAGYTKLSNATTKIMGNHTVLLHLRDQLEVTSLVTKAAIAVAAARKHHSDTTSRAGKAASDALGESAERAVEANGFDMMDTEAGRVTSVLVGDLAKHLPPFQSWARGWMGVTGWA